MPNTIGGKSYKKNKSGNIRRRNRNPDIPVDVSTGLDFYAVVQKRLGNNRLLVKLYNGNEVQAVIPGKFMRRVWFKTGDYIQVRSTGDNFYDVIQKIVNQNEQNNAETAFRKRESGEKDIFRTNLSDDDSCDDDDNFNDFNNNSDIEDFDEFGNKILSKKDNKNNNIHLNINDSDSDSDSDDNNINNKSKDIVYKQTIKIEKIKRKQKEKERDLQRQNAEKDNDIYLKPISLIENNSDSSTDSSTDSD